MTTIAEFIKANGIKMNADQADRNPNMADDSDWGRGASHWKCTFRKGQRQMTTYFSQGAAHTKAPKAADVLNCLASDAGTIDNARSFEDWASELGYDQDSRKAERIHKACLRETDKLEDFLGRTAFDTLLRDVERL
jgi:hypothetical protein